MIGLVTAIIGDVAGHLGCFIFLKDSVNAIAFVALGTSVPGTLLSSQTLHENTFLVRCPFAVKLTPRCARLLLRKQYIFTKLRSLRECEYFTRNWQRLPLLLHFFGLHWCLYRCYRWCRRSLGLLHQLEGFRQRYCFRRPRNLRSWYEIWRFPEFKTPPKKRSKKANWSFELLFQDTLFYPEWYY